jgi:hypothetical protein
VKVFGSLECAQWIFYCDPLDPVSSSLSLNGKVGDDSIISLGPLQQPLFFDHLMQFVQDPHHVSFFIVVSNYSLHPQIFIALTFCTNFDHSSSPFGLG